MMSDDDVLSIDVSDDGGVEDSTSETKSGGIL